MRSVQQHFLVYLLAVCLTARVTGKVIQQNAVYSDGKINGASLVQPQSNISEKPSDPVTTTVKNSENRLNEKADEESQPTTAGKKPTEEIQSQVDVKTNEDKQNENLEKLKNEEDKGVEVKVTSSESSVGEKDTLNVRGGSTSQVTSSTIQPDEEEKKTAEEKPVKANVQPTAETNNDKSNNTESKRKDTSENSKPEVDKPSVQEEPKPEESKVTYRGYKVLRVVLQNKDQKKMIKQLENNGDISTWMGNGTAVDILIRKNNVFDWLEERKLRYDVVIEDLQKAIEEENPPIAEDEWSELEGRKVDVRSHWIGNGFLSPYQHWMFSGIPQRGRDPYKSLGDHGLKGLRKTKIKKKIKKKKIRRKRGHRMTWQMYHRMADIYGYLDYLTATYPEMCSQETIGYTIEKKPLKVLKISSGKENAKAIWVDSGIHAREWISPATSTYVINQMVENGDGTHGLDWYFLPLANPDGYEHSHTVDRLWRKNRANAYRGPCAGTDLNRNFGYRWGGSGSSQQPCRETYAGQGPFSEPEANAIKEYIMKKSKNLKGYITLHSYGQYILYPWGYDRKVPPDYSDLHRVGRAMAQAMKTTGGQNYKVGSAAATLYPAAGGSDDWAKGAARIKYAYTIELRDTGRHGFVLPAQYIQPTGQEAYAALKVLASEIEQL